MPSYADQLKHPKWQRKRLEVMQRERFTCQGCRAVDRSLQIHHTYYTKGHQPWEYPDAALLCLCEPCHQRLTRATHELQDVVAQLSSMHIDLVNMLLGYAHGLLFLHNDWSLAWKPAGLGRYTGMSDALRVSTEDAESFARQGEITASLVTRFPL